jgi:hypothetical protein
MSKIKAIHTSCKNCVFSIYKDITQTGCSLDYISKYKNIGSEILDVYDEEKEFFVINDKKCLGYRENKWFQEFGLEHSTLEEKIKKFKELNHIGYSLNINVNNFNSIEEIVDIFRQINTIKIFPRKITFIRLPDCNISFEELKNSLPILEKEKITWRVQNMIDKTEHIEELIYTLSINNKKYRFMCYLDSHISNIDNIIKTANSFVYEDLKFFNAITDKDSKCLMFSVAIYRYALVEQKKNILLDKQSHILI